MKSKRRIKRKSFFEKTSERPGTAELWKEVFLRKNLRKTVSRLWAAKEVFLRKNLRKTVSRLWAALCLEKAR